MTSLAEEVTRITVHSGTFFLCKETCPSVYCVVLCVHRNLILREARVLSFPLAVVIAEKAIVFTCVCLSVG